MATKGTSEDDGSDIEKPSKASSSGNHDLRTLCLKVIATVMTKMEDLDFNPIYWDILFKAISPSIPKFAAENHSSSAPGAVFSCLVAMGRSVELAPLLSRDPALVPSVAKVLSMKAASPAVIAAVIGLIEGLLNLEDEEGDKGKEVVMTVLLPHLHVLLSRIHDLLINRREKTT
jgi:U3 small nucleolar RNA-associated protein 20